MKSGSCVKPGGWRWWVGPSFPLGRASGENLVQTGTAPFGYQPLPGTSVPMTHPWYSEVQEQDDVGGRGHSMAREHVATAITRSPLAGRASEPPRARRSAGPSASSPCPSPSAPQRHTFTPSWKTPSFPPPSGLSLGELSSGLRLEPPTHLDAATPRRHPATGPSQSR